MDIFKDKRVIFGVLVVVIIVIVVIVMNSGSKSDSGKSVKINGKTVVITSAPAVTVVPTSAPTTSAPTTRAPTTSAPTTSAPTRAPVNTNVQVVSLERYDNEPINLGEIFLYDASGVKINPSLLKAIENPAHGSFPAAYLLDNDGNSFAHTDNGIGMVNPENYVMYGDAIGSDIPVQHIAWVSSIGKQVVMINDDGWLKMATVDNTQQRYTSNGAGTHPALIFDESKWNNGYNIGGAGYQVKLKSGPTQVPNKLQYMQIILLTPTKLSKIEIINRQDCCQERINGLVVKTINNSRQLISSIVLNGSSGSNSRFILNYSPALGNVTFVTTV
jgi:hypothetical protein